MNTPNVYDAVATIMICSALLLIAAFVGWLVDTWPERRQRAQDFRAARRLEEPRRINQIRRDPSPKPR